MSYWSNAETIDNFKVSEYTHSTDAGGNKLSEGGETNGYEQIGASRELGRKQNPSKIKRLSRVGEVGHLQPQKSDTPHTKSIHRSGVSAEVITSSGFAAERHR